MRGPMRRKVPVAVAVLLSLWLVACAADPEGESTDGGGPVPVDATHDSVRSPDASADACLYYAFAQVERAQNEVGKGRDASLRRAQDACLDGESRAPSRRSAEVGLRRTLLALRLAVTEELAGRRPDESVLYQAGLGQLVVKASPRKHADVIGLLRDSAPVPSAA